jgi:hypothetical protein
VSILTAVCLAFGVSLLFFPALRAPVTLRVVVFVCVAGLVGLAPWMLPASARVARFVVAIYSGLLVLKLWDLHVGARRSICPSWPQFLGFMANPLSLVHRRTGSECQPTRRENLIRLLKSLLVAALALLALNFLLILTWGSTPFLVEHVLKATTFFVGATALFSGMAAVGRLLGGYAPEPMNHPLTGRTPAEFWRRYNRWIGEGLREDFFSLLAAVGGLFWAR